MQIAAEWRLTMSQTKKRMMLLVPMLHQGGFEKVCVVTARLLEPYYDVYVVIFDSKDIAYDIKGINVIDLRLGSKKGAPAKAMQVIRRCIGVMRLKKDLKIDISYSFGPTANLVNALTCRNNQVWLGIRSYMDMGNPRQIRFFSKKSDKLICCSETIRKEIEEKYKCNHAYTLHNPFDIAEVTALAMQEEAEIPWEDGRIIVSMGREDVVKGFWHLLKIFSEVHKKLPDTKLMIIGKGGFEEYRQLARDLGIDEAVYFTGLKKNPYPYLKKSSLYLLTSYYEGFPNALVEAMALGIPAVATDCMTGPREILEDKYGILIPNMSPEPDMNAENIGRDEQTVASCVVGLLEDEKEMNRYRKLAVERASMYSKDKYVQKIREWAEDQA